jgi:hypothetical protein
MGASEFDLAQMLWLLITTGLPRCLFLRPSIRKALQALPNTQRLAGRQMEDRAQRPKITLKPDEEPQSLCQLCIANWITVAVFLVNDSCRVHQFISLDFHF